MPRLQDAVTRAKMPRIHHAPAHARQDAAPTRRGGGRAAKCPAYSARRRTRGKMPRLQGMVADTRQNAQPTRPRGGREARCPAYSAWRRMRGKMPRLQDVVTDERQNAQPTSHGGGRAARCRDYKARWRTRGKMPRLQRTAVYFQVSSCTAWESALSRMAVHHFRFSAYQRTVSRSPDSKLTCGSQPSWRRIFDESNRYRRS